MQVLSVGRSHRILQGTVKLPLSKSISNRVLIIGRIAGYDFSMEDLSDADDTLLLRGIIVEDI
jgi:5-enolpyruvylshikimate-3-phosphate synthase